MNRIKAVATTSVACAALLAAVPTGLAVHAQQNPGTGTPKTAAPGGAAPKKAKAVRAAARAVNRLSMTYGTLTTLTATTATITTSTNSTVTVTLAPTATYVARSQAAAIAGLKTNDQVAAFGRFNNGFTAVRLAYDTVPFSVAPVAFAGAVTNNSGGTLTVSLANGQSKSVTTNSTTRYRVNGKAVATAPTLASNQKVRILAQQYTNGSVVARIIATTSA